MAGSLTLESWPGTSGVNAISYFSQFVEQMQSGMPGDPPGILPFNLNQILGGYGAEFKVFADSTGMQVKIWQGQAYCKGIFCRMTDASAPSQFYTLDVTAAHATLYRIDTVVIEVTFATGACTLKMLNGTAAAVASAIPTALTQNATTWQIPLAYVFVSPAVATISGLDVADCRQFCPTNNELARIGKVENPIIWGGFNYWPEGTTFTSIADATFGPDQWVYQKAGAVVHDLLRSTDVPTIAEANAQFSLYSLHLDVTTADASIAAGDLSIIGNHIEGYLFHPFAQRGFSLSFWVKDSIVGIHAVTFRNSTADPSCVCEYVISAADTWEFHTVHVPPSPSAGTWDYTNGLGLSVTFTLSVGSTFQQSTGTAGAWVTGNFLGTARTVNSTSSTSNNFKLAMVGPLTLGNLTIPFSPRPFPTELAMAQRYYRKWGPGAANTAYASGSASANNGMIFSLPISPPMRAAPSVISLSAVGDFSGDDGVTIAALNALAIGAASPDAVQLSATQAGTTWTAKSGALLLGNTSATLALKARL